MKKIIIFFTIISVLCLTINVFASDSYQSTVKVGNVDTPVYYVETTWGKMQFTYNEQINYGWDSNTHTYELTDSTYQWIGTDNYIDINNKSTHSVNVELVYDSFNENVSGDFDKKESTLNINDNVRFTLTLNGELSENNTEYVRVGTINLIIK